MTKFEDLDKSQKISLVMLGIFFAKEKSAIQLLTLRTDAEAIFYLRNEDWIRISSLEIRYRPLFEGAIKEEWHRFENLWAES